MERRRTRSSAKGKAPSARTSSSRNEPGRGSRSGKRGARGRGSGSRSAGEKGVSPQTPPRIQSTIARKQASKCQVPDHLTPSRIHLSSMAKVSNHRPELSSANTSKTSIKEIKVEVSVKDNCAFYTISLLNCPSRVGRIKVRTEKHVFDARTRGDEPYFCMMQKTRARIHDSVTKFNIDLSAGKGPEYMNSEWPWKFLWKCVEIEFQNSEIESLKNSIASMKAAETKSEITKSKEWTRGSGYGDTDKDVKAKHRAKTSLLEELGLVSKKDLSKAESILSGIVRDMNKYGLDVSAVLPKKDKEKDDMCVSMIQSAESVMKILAKTRSISSLRLLTGFIAMLLPISEDFSARSFCDILGINRNAKYVTAAVENRKLFNKYSSETGPIQIGTNVVCKAGVGVLHSRGHSTMLTIDKSVTVKLLPWGTMITYDTEAKGQLRRQEPPLDQYNREQRFDVTPDADKERIEQFFRDVVPQSPNKKDTIKIRHELWPTQFQEKRALHRYETYRELWLRFKDTHPDLYEKYKYDKQPFTAPKIFRENAPFEMVKAPDQSCLCVSCEDMVNLLRGSTAASRAIDAIIDSAKPNGNSNNETLQANLEKLQTIKSILTKPSKYDAMVACLGTCLPTGRLEDARYECLEGKCDKCSFKTLWTNGVKLTLLDNNGNVLSESGLVSDIWKDSAIDWRYFTHSVAPTVGSHAQEVARQAASARANNNAVDADDDDGDYNPIGSKKPSRSLILATKRGTLIDYLDEFEEKSQAHTKHRNIVALDFEAKTNYDQNVRPLIVTRSIDFAENGTIKDKRQAQSQYWVSLQYTLFVSICSWVSVDEWNKTDGSLKTGDEVTVYGEMAGEKINMNSFWGKITRIVDSESGMYEVTDKNGSKHTIQRADLRHRKKINVASGHVTPDKKHDRHAMQHFTNNEIKRLEEYMKEKYPADLPDGKFKRFHTKSDNAKQHFKSTGSMQYFTSLAGNGQGAALVYSFGAPHHGKCMNDGVGGGLKNCIDGVCGSSVAKEGRIDYTESGYIVNAKDVFNTMYHFYGDGRGIERDRQFSKKNFISHFMFFYYDDAENPIPRAEETFNTLDGMSDRYQYAVKCENIIYMRMRVCWCLHCMSELMEGTLEWGRCHSVSGCSASTDELVDDERELVDMFKFEERHCNKLTGPGVTRRITDLKERRNEETMKLVVGDWICMDSSDENEPIWLGRVMSNEDWGGQGIFKNETTRTKKYDNGTYLTRGDIGVYVMWYEKIDVNTESLDYHVSRTITKPSVQNNLYVVCCGFQMHRIVGRNNPVPRRRKNSGRNNKRDYNDWHDREYGIIWKMDTELRQEALSRCGMWR